MNTIRLASTDEDILKCWEVMNALRPHLKQDTFLPLVREMIAEGYQLAFIEENGKAVSAIGFRYQQYLFNGKHFYIDDLSSLPESRGKGYGNSLLNYVTDLAREKGYKVITLDSGPARHDAHRLYLNNGFTISSMHFTKNISL
jgi:GNAT superfamily N-acetyltransferase